MFKLPSQFSKPNDIILVIDPGTSRCFSKWGRLTPKVLEDAKTRPLKSSDLKLKPIIGDGNLLGCSRYPTTQLYYDEDEVLTGHATTKKMEDLKFFDPSRLVSNWKLGYGSESDNVSRMIRQRLDTQAKHLGKDSRRENGKDWARYYLQGKLLNGIEKECGDSFDPTRVFIGVCMPPGWIGDHEKMLEDLCPPGYNTTQMFAVSETEATFRQWAADKDTAEWNGRPIAVINCGGGTIDVSSFIKDSESDDFRHLQQDRSSHAGSEVISEAFEQAVLLKFPKALEDKALLAYRFRKKFDEKKRTFGSKPDRSDMFRYRLSDCADKMTANDERDTEIIFNYEELKALFQDTLTSILDLLQEHINAGFKVQSRGRIIFTGGGSASPYLYRELRNFTNSKGLDLLTLDETNQKDDLVEGAADSLLNIDRLTRTTFSTQSRGVILYVNQREMSEEMLESFQFAERIKLAGSYHLLLVQWFIKVGEEPQDSARKWNGSQQEPCETLFPIGLPLRFHQQIAVTEQHPGDTMYSPISKDGHVISADNGRVQCKFEEICWDLEKQQISSKHLTRTSKIDRGVRIPYLKLQFRLLIDNNEFEIKYGLDVVVTRNKTPKKTRSVAVCWGEHTPLDRRTFNVSKYLKKAYEISPKQSALVGNLDPNDETPDYEDKMDREMAERRRLYDELWSKLHESMDSRAMPREEAAINGQLCVLESLDKQRSQSSQQDYPVASFPTPEENITTDESMPLSPYSSDSDISRPPISCSPQNQRNPNKQYPLQMSKGKERVVDRNNQEGSSRTRSPLSKNHHNIYPLARRGGFQPINPLGRPMHKTNSGSKLGKSSKAATSAFPDKRRRLDECDMS